MKKMPTLFEREYENHKVVGITDKLSDPSLQIVLDGKTVPTVKIDGSCVAVIDGKWYKRYDCKKGKKAPEGAIPCQPEADKVTGHWPHWVELNSDKPEDKWFMDAFYNYSLLDENRLPDNTNGKAMTFEAIGPHFQGNPYGLVDDSLYQHGSKVIDQLNNISLTFDMIREFLSNNIIEGIVFWYDGKPLCKIKRSDFSYEWPVSFKKE